MPDENTLSVGLDSPLMHRCERIRTLSVAEMHWDARTSNSVKHEKAEKWSSVYTVGVNVSWDFARCLWAEMQQ